MAILKTATLDLGTASGIINMSGVGSRYVVEGFAFTDLSGQASVGVSVSGNGVTMLGTMGSGVGWCAQKASVGPLMSGDLSWSRAGVPVSGASVVVNVIGEAVP